MRLLRIQVDGAPLYKDNKLSLDFYATDRVVKNEEGLVEDVHQIGQTGSIYSQNIIGLSGINASGKTTTLNILRFVLRYMTGSYTMRVENSHSQRIGKLGNELNIIVVFWEKGKYYQINSQLSHTTKMVGESAFGGSISTDSISFVDETLWLLTARRPTRLMIGSSKEFEKNATIILRRNGDKDDPHVLSPDQKDFLDDKTSIVSKISGRKSAGLDYPERRLGGISMPTPVMRAFDASIEYLKWDSDSQVFHLKFEGEGERIVSMEVAVAMLSKGTLLGAEMVDHAISMLRMGGCLIVDEIETSLNRSLVGVIIGLFASPATNPHGAQLVFSTHYPELLDLLHRKDDIYLLRRTQNYKTEVVKYSNCGIRIENKKSEAFINNIITGAVPRYPDVQDMRSYVLEHVNE